MTVRLVHVVPLLTRICSTPVQTGTGMLFLDESHVTIAAHLLRVEFFVVCFGVFFASLVFWCIFTGGRLCVSK